MIATLIPFSTILPIFDSSSKLSNSFLISLNFGGKFSSVISKTSSYSGKSIFTSMLARSSTIIPLTLLIFLEILPLRPFKASFRSKSVRDLIKLFTASACDKCSFCKLAWFG